jgi:hypothetical protein
MLRLLWLLIVGRWPKGQAGLRAARCSYNLLDCKARPSPLCWDGRCRHHCQLHCECERSRITREEAEMIGEYRRSTRAIS